MGSTESDVVSKAEAILAAAKKYNGNRQERYELMKQLDLLYLELEDPVDALMRQWTFMNTSTSLDVMVKMGAFEKMPKQGSITAEELGKLIKLPTGIVVRLMRMLTGTGVVALTGEDTYAHTPKSMAYLEGAAVDFFNLCINMRACYFKWPEYFKTKSPEDLVDLRKTPYSFAYGREGLTFYEVLTENPERFNMFNKAMMQQEAGLPILGMFPFKSLEEQVKAEPDRAFMVDIGGGRGQALLAIANETGNVFGMNSKLILQDRPPVLDSVPQDLLPGVEKMPYDFYTEQPVKNAHIYYYRRIMHNYQDDVCISILKQAVAAMGPTSRLLIADLVIPAQTEVGEDMSPYWMDMVMIAIGGKERSEKEFKQLLEDVGLEFVKVWREEGGGQAVVEGRLKQ
ncbi:S-adenosyl-L-methionine-dependent methyltransferase [Glarea lozoyensis ATCC 20868]|uniref:S-adenosyl-L-methionine-dependent methyltransferase n=1 Tax=Glarea lozoyensis (strain ATCC 20868 / MF5171) TaxID=1116229 RepID=S3DYD8_GLAL2|nr:S-adenosyl-L-methionine-dependent methyltransferase [Glarea lozoyensis ATCC 20868]EPE31358.1 S-adenosyl-L-methionine-dependent methyltransferase [Glarea lozoyensis ATCC 20868]